MSVRPVLVIGMQIASFSLIIALPAVGFALGNVILVEGDDGVIIIDTSEGMDAAREIKAEFETDDQIYVWLPDLRILFPGDNFYRAFPNLYAIRGVPLRRVDHWVESLAKMIEEDAEHLVPSHTRPIIGSAKVRSALQAYHDGVKSVLDQTMAGMNRGLRPDELARTVRLPEELAGSPFLREFYGTVEWAVRTAALEALGEQQISANARNWYLTSVQWLRERAREN